jgi:mannose-6-phosphate isomerase-like protein (cupin superfamily)
MDNSEIKIKTLIEKLIDSVYKTSELKTKKPEVELVQNILNGKPTDDRPYFDVYIKTFTSTENNFEFYIFKRKLEKRISIVFGRRITLRLFFDSIIPKNFHVLKDKANQYKEELQEKVNEYVNRQSIIGNDISINIDDVKVINTNWVGGNRMSFNVFATCENKSNKEEILRVDNPIIQRDLNTICTELLGHEYNDGVISGYSLEVEFVKNESSEINESKKDDIKDFIKKNTDKIKDAFKEELKNSSDDAKTAFKHLITKKKELTKEEREEISKELKQVFKRTAKRLGMASLFILPGGTILVILLNLFTKKKEVPYDETISEGKKVRLFTESIDNHELKWHRDREDRLVEVIEGEGWQLQFDDELPFNLEKGMSLIIPEGVYHRVIKGSGNLKVSITVLD